MDNFAFRSMMKPITIFTTMVSVALLSGCIWKQDDPDLPITTNEPDTMTVPSSTQSDKQLQIDATWIAYWDQDDVDEEIPHLKSQHASICLFGALFDDEGRPYIHEETLNLSDSLLKTEECDFYLTFVNDWMKEDGSSLKDTDLLYSLLGTPERARNHARDVLEMTSQLGCSGIEIDYERIRDDLELWEHFQNFLEILIADANELGISVRVLLEPSTPIEQLDLPDGAEYVVMCYNLYGQGTEPGPKADEAFLCEMVSTFQVLPDVSFALANGGYIWNNQTGDAEQISTDEAEIRAMEEGAIPKRDPENGCLSYSYDTDDESYTVYYGDDETMERWQEILEDAAGTDVPISIWRIGG